MNGTSQDVNLSLISHTNAGKTTLARTLLGQDVGEVRDAPHVTEIATAYPMLRTGDGLALTLWDTPGFGDTARLLRRLRLAGNPIGWLLAQAWDRWRERPLWCSQQAVRNARDHADVVLYLVNSAEDPADAGYVDLEMQILEWIGKPVVLLLNQMGPPRQDGSSEREKWQRHLQRFPIVREVLALDAFARCWVQEQVLLRRLAPLLPAGKQPAFERLAALWRENNQVRFDKAMQILARQLAHAACDRERLDSHGWQSRLGGMLGAGQQREQKRAMELLAQRLDAEIRAATDSLIALHGLQGKAAAEVLRRLREDFAASEPVKEGFAAMIGGLVSGAMGGLAADLAAGGLTFGGGMVAGGIVGALGASGVARAINLVRGEQQAAVRWSAEFFEGLVRSALLRYLAVTHFGRGRGNYAQSEHPAFWQDMVAAEVGSRRAEIHAIWQRGKTATGPETLSIPLAALLAGCAQRLLAALYPEAGLAIA
jgi:hypothetical protein